MAGDARRERRVEGRRDSAIGRSLEAPRTWNDDRTRSGSRDSETVRGRERALSVDIIRQADVVGDHSLCESEIKIKNSLAACASLTPSCSSPILLEIEIHLSSSQGSRSSVCTFFFCSDLILLSPLCFRSLFPPSCPVDKFLPSITSSFISFQLSSTVSLRPPLRPSLARDHQIYLSNSFTAPFSEQTCAQ